MLLLSQKEKKEKRKTRNIIYLWLAASRLLSAHGSCDLPYFEERAVMFFWFILLTGWHFHLHRSGLTCWNWVPIEALRVSFAHHRSHSQFLTLHGLTIHALWFKWYLRGESSWWPYFQTDTEISIFIWEGRNTFLLILVLTVFLREKN